MPTSKPSKLTEAQQVMLVRASQNENGELISPDATAGIGKRGSAEELGLSPNEIRSVEALNRKGMIEGDLEQPTGLLLTAGAFEALHIDEAEWPERLRGSVAEEVPSEKPGTPVATPAQLAEATG